ncbi:DUF4214 domain-containing protein [Modicisalibacter radicis]|uniref:DUF4214 domain-containing protein n=1 Tax=Halomonas sp. EAR18 TaxID=2518972 RepID=UPI00109C2C7D|nr:DUF4214 domain-containing protein [Halomonas sp. EAR18]
MANQFYLDTVQSLYVAYYGRPADPSGQKYWAERLEASDGKLGEIINAFGTSPEYASRLGNSDAATQVNTLYQQLFGRAAEDEGRAFYANMINSGEKTLAEIALTIREAAQGSDRTTFEGRTVVAKAFTQELNTPEKIEAYSSDRGIGIGRAYLERVTEQTSSDDVLSEAAPVVETLLPETEPETPPTGGGTPTPPAPTFTATLHEHAVIFGGTATGPIALTNDHGEWTFTRGNLTATVSGENVNGIALGDAALTANGSLLDDISVTGTGQLTLNDLAGSLDLSGLAETLNVTATVSSSQDISENTNLSAIDTYQVGSDATLTMTLEQYAGTTLKGQGTLKFSDDIAPLLTITNTNNELESITIALIDNDIGQRSVAEVQAFLSLEKLVDSSGEKVELSNLTYTLVDTSAALSSSNSGVAEIVEGAGNVETSDAASILQAITIHDRANGASYSITDYASTIINRSTDADTLSVLQAATSVTASGTVSAATAVDLHGISEFSIDYNIYDNYTNITNEATGVIDSAVNLSTYTQIDTTQAINIIAFDNSGTTSISSIEDTAAATNSFVDANERSEKLDYSFSVRDTSTAILTAIQDSTSFIYGKAVNDFEIDARVQKIVATTNFDLTGAQTFWEAVSTAFDVVDDNEATVSTTAQKTTYTISDEIENYDNEAAGTEWVVNADVRIITGTAEDISQAQNNSSNTSHDIFELVNESDQDRLVVTGSAGNQTITGGPGNNSIDAGDGNDTVTGGGSGDTINGGAGYDTLKGEAGNDTIHGDAGNDTIHGGTGNDTIYGDTGYDTLYGEEGRDTIYAGSSSSTGSSIHTTRVTGGEDGDDMYGSGDADLFIYEGSDRNELARESSTTYSTRDYITDFSLGDKIEFQGGVDDVQFFSSGSANASDVEAGELGLSIRYEKNANVTNWAGTDTVDATRIFIDVADEDGHFDDIADMHIILVGSDIDINWDGSSIVFGG